MASALPGSGPACVADLSRREFVKALGVTALASSSVAGVAPRGETAVARLYRALADDQRARIVFPSDHPLRSKVENNWAIVKPTIADLTAGQQALCREIFRGLCSEEGHERFMKQMDDDSGGFGRYHVALFGEPGTDGPFEWVLTGRHATLRADGNRDDGAVAIGPIFLGHARGGPELLDNVWWYQGRRADAIFNTLASSSRARALVTRAGPDGPRATGPDRVKNVEPGLPVAGLDGPQKAMVRLLLGDLCSPFRTFDVEPIRRCLRDPGGVDALRLTFFKTGDPGDGRAWDAWKLEGSAFTWYYHASPHVHSWVTFDRERPDA
jgi:hypothetical protein